MRICFVAPISSKNLGGISSWISIVKDNMPENYESFFIDTSLRHSFSKKRTFFDKYIYSFFRVFEQKRNLKRMILHEKIDILHIATSGGFGFYRDLQLLKIARTNNVKTILHFHFGRIPALISSKKGLEYQLFLKCLEYSDFLISIDKNTFECLNSNWISSYYVPNPTILHANLYSSNSKNILFVGHVTPEKGIFELINSFSVFSKRFPDWKLFIVGPCQKRVKKEMERKCSLNGVTFFGPVSHEEVISFMRDSSFLVLPSYTEGMPNVILEAMSCGLPCIGTSVGNMPEMLKDTGMIVPPKSVTALNDALSRMATDKQLRERLSSASYERIAKEYMPSLVIQKMIEVWEK